jgi:DNA polymerase-3 subunit delta'
MLKEWLNAIIKTGPVAQVKWIDEAAKLGREKQKQFLKYFIHLLQQAIRLRVIIPTNEKQEASNDFALRLNKICDLGQQQAIITELDKASYYIERNANAKMLFHALSIRLYHIINNKSLILVN